MVSWRERGGRLAVMTCLLTLTMGSGFVRPAFAEPAPRVPAGQVAPSSASDALPFTSVPTVQPTPAAERALAPWRAPDAEGPAPATAGRPATAPREAARDPIYARVVRRVPVGSNATVSPSPSRHGRPVRALASRGSRSLASRQRTWFVRQEILLDISPLITKYAQLYNLDPHLVRAVIEVESQYRAHAVSRCGAMGLMQLMPGTGHSMGARDLHDPEQNIAAGTRYLRAMLNRYSGRWESAIAAYNAGPGNVSMAGGIPNISETRRYVWKVFRAYHKFLEVANRPTPPQRSSVASPDPVSPTLPLSPSSEPPLVPLPSSAAPAAPGS